MIVALYATPTVPLGSVLVKESGDRTKIDAGAEAVAPNASFTCTLKLEVPLAFGIPEMSPVEGEIDRLEGSDPETTTHE